MTPSSSALSRRVSSWGRLSAEPHEVFELTDTRRITETFRGRTPGIAYGMGRSYGDQCLNPGGVLWSTASLDRFVRFDPASGRLACQAGVRLADIQRMAIPRGWNLPVVPGTQLATVGGAIANDVHGKNHHRSGTFGNHVTALRLLRTTGETIDCGPDRRREWLAATLGGMGLTGLIVEAELQLSPVAGPWLEAETIAYRGLEEFLHLSDESAAAWDHTVSWIDCGSGAKLRGLFMRARPAAPQPGRVWRERVRTLPVTPPLSLVNRLSLRPLNGLYYHAGKRRRGTRIVHYQPFLYPLDAIRNWNRLYGPRGFYQYQCLVPRQTDGLTIVNMLDAIARSGDGSVLAVLKTFGERQACGLLSFVRPGITLALDFQNRTGIERLFETLDAIVLAANGRLYPAKDARMPRELFEKTYSGLQEFQRYRDPGMSSAMSRRLMGS